MATLRRFTETYKEEMYQLWWDRGRPSFNPFHKVMPADELGFTPERSTVQTWVTEWNKRAEILDEQIKAELEARMVHEKVNMLARHADIGKRITDKALEYLDENDFPSAATALRALTEGIRIERESRGLPDAIRKMTLAEDDDVLKQVEELMSKVDIIEDDEGQMPNLFK